LRLFKNRVLKKIFGNKRDEVTGKLRKLHNEELNDTYCGYSCDQIKNNEMGRACSTFCRQKSCVQGFGGKT